MVRLEELGQTGLLEERILEIFRTNRCRTVEELVKAVEKNDRTISLEEIRDAIESLRDESVIILIEPPIDRSFTSYMKSDYIGNLPFWMALTATALTLGLTFLLVGRTTSNGILETIRIVAGSAAVLIIPGYGLSNMLFPKREHEERNSTITHLGIGFGLSFAIIPILWLVLMQSPANMRSDLIVISISIAGILLNFGAVYRRFSVRRKKAVVSAPIAPSSTDKPSTVVSETSPAVPTSKIDQP